LIFASACARCAAARVSAAAPGDTTEAALATASGTGRFKASSP
jgi:hypothetical protein